MDAANFRVRGNRAPISSDTLFLIACDALFFAASASTCSFSSMPMLPPILYECTVSGVVSPRVQAHSDAGKRRNDSAASAGRQTGLYLTKQNLMPCSGEGAP